MFFKLFASVLLISSTLAQASSSNSLSGTPVPPSYSSSPVTVRVGQASEESVQVKFPAAIRGDLRHLNVPLDVVRLTKAIEYHARHRPLKFCLNYTKDGSCPYIHRCQFVHSMLAHAALKQFIDSEEQAQAGVSPISNASIGYVIEDEDYADLSFRATNPIATRLGQSPHLYYYPGSSKYRHNPYGFKATQAEEDQD